MCGFVGGGVEMHFFADLIDGLNAGDVELAVPAVVF